MMLGAWIASKLRVTRLIDEPARGTVSFARKAVTVRSGLRVAAAAVAILCSCAISCATMPLPKSSPLPAPPELPEGLTPTTTRSVEAVTLAPHVEMEDGPTPAVAIVVPMPEDRIRFRRVDVVLSITRHDDGSLADKQSAVFNRNTLGDSLWFVLPPLSEGNYDAEVRAIALIDTVGSGGALSVEERESRAVVSVVATAPPAPIESVEELRFHFKPGRVRLVDADWKVARLAIKKIKSALAGGHIVRATIDCWASGEGDEDFNIKLAEDRCDWFRNNVWDQVRGTRGHLLDDTAHGSEELPAEEPENGSWMEIEAVRQQNRVAVFQLVTSS